MRYLYRHWLKSEKGPTANLVKIRHGLSRGPILLWSIG